MNRKKNSKGPVSLDKGTQVGLLWLALWYDNVTHHNGKNSFDTVEAAHFGTHSPKRRNSEQHRDKLWKFVAESWSWSRSPADISAGKLAQAQWKLERAAALLQIKTLQGVPRILKNGGNF